MGEVESGSLPLQFDRSVNGVRHGAVRDRNSDADRALGTGRRVSMRRSWTLTAGVRVMALEHGALSRSDAWGQKPITGALKCDTWWQLERLPAKHLSR